MRVENVSLKFNVKFKGGDISSKLVSAIVLPFNAQLRFYNLTLLFLSLSYFFQASCLEGIIL